MSTPISDLNDAIANLAAASNAVFSSAGDVLTATQAAAARVAALPTTPVDYTEQVTAINDVIAQLNQSKSSIDSAITTAQGIAP